MSLRANMWRLPMTGSALAEEASYTPVNADELLGVWQSEDDDALVLYMLPGTYAPVNDLSRMPELYAEGKWQETRERQLDYLMLLNKRREQRNSFLDSLRKRGSPGCVRDPSASSRVETGVSGTSLVAERV